MTWKAPIWRNGSVISPISPALRRKLIGWPGLDEIPLCDLSRPQHATQRTGKAAAVGKQINQLIPIACRSSR